MSSVPSSPQVLGKDLTSKVVAGGRALPALAFAVPSLWKVAMARCVCLPQRQRGFRICFASSRILAGWACGDGPSC